MKQVQSRLSWSRLSLLMSVLVLLILAGCATTVAPTGSLKITITGLDGEDASISVTGPGDYSTTLTLTQGTTLSDLTPGSYSVKAKTAGELVATITPPSATVAAGKTATVTVAYASPADETPDDGDVGSLTVTITDLPAGVVGAGVLVEGAGGFSQLVTQSATIDLTPGLYRLSTKAGQTTGDPIVSKAYYNLVAPPEAIIEVVSGMTASTKAKFALRSRSSTLWLAQGLDTTPGGVLGFSAKHLESLVASKTPDDASMPLDAAAAPVEASVVVVDGDGDLWVLLANGEALEYDASGSVKTVMLGELMDPVSGAFDDAGSLWVAYANTADAKATPNGMVAEFRAKQLDGAMATPSLMITELAPAGIAFDADGNLWVANNASDGDDETTNDGAIVMFSPTQLGVSALSVTLVPEVTISGTELATDADAPGQDLGLRNLNGPAGVAFDADGNLWVSNAGEEGTSTIVKFTPSQLAESKSHAPGVMITVGGGDLLTPAGLAFDNSGDLWVMNVATDGGNTSFLLQFSDLGRLSGPVNPTPITSAAVMASSPASLAFSTSPMGLFNTP